MEAGSSPSPAVAECGIYLTSLNMSADALLLWCICEQGHMEEELKTKSKCLNYCHGMGKKSHFKCLCAIQEKA